MMAGSAFAADSESITLALATPHPGFTAEIKQVHASGDRTLVLVKVTPPPADREYPLFLVTEYDTVLAESDVPDEITFYIIGHTWNWSRPDDNIVYLSSRRDYYDAVEAAGARLVNIRRSVSPRQD